MNQYDILSKIGQGADASVYKAINRINNKYVAIKVYNIDQTIGINKSALREISSLNKMNHKHIIKIHDIIYCQMDDVNVMQIVMDYTDNNLTQSIDDILKDTNNIDHACMKILLQLLDALNYMYQIGYIHGDINSNNIIYENGQIQLIDFTTSTKLYRNQIIGNPTIYACPIELLNKNSTYVPNVIDTWALACLYYLLLTGYVLFLSNDHKSHLQNIITYVGQPSNYFLNKYNISCICVNSENGKNKPFIYINNNDNKRIIKKMLQLNPNKRYNIDKLINDKIIIENLNKFNYKLEDVNIYKMYEQNNIQNINSGQRVEIFDLISEINDSCNFTNETYHHAIINTEKFCNNKEIAYTSLNNNKVVALIFYWISTKILTDSEWNCESIINLLKNKFNITIPTMIEIEIYMCKMINWNIDSLTMYDFIVHVPKKFHKYYILIGIIFLLNSDIAHINEFTKAICAFVIIKTCFNLKNNKFDKIIEKYKKEKNEEIQYFDIVNYFVSIIQNTNNSTIPTCIDKYVKQNNLSKYFTILKNINVNQLNFNINDI